MKKIIHFSLANTKGGITHYVLDNWKYIDRTKFQFDVATFGGKLDFQEELEAEGCKVFYVKHRAEDNLKKFRKEILQIFANGYDAVHLHTSYWKSFELERLARQAGIPKIIVHAHNTGVFDDSGREEKEKQHYMLRDKLPSDLATDYWACSEKAARWLYADKILPEKIQILKNAVDTQHFAYSERIRKQYRSRLNWEDQFVIGHIGRFSYQKNHEFLIDVFRKIVLINGKARLLLIGKGPLEIKIQAMATAYGLSDRICFAGVCEDVNCWLQAMDIFALPSRFEGFPIVAVEAQTAGVTSILSNTITEEAKMVENVMYLPLKEEIWVNEISLKMNQDLSRGIHERAANAEIVKQQGYDSKCSIKELERLYESPAN